LRNSKLIPRLDVRYELEDFHRALGDSDEWQRPLRAALEKFWPGMEPVFVNSGRVAILLALRSLGLGQGSRVGVPVYTCEAVYSAVVRSGAIPVFLDVNVDTLTLDPVDLERKSGDLDGVVAVHTFGHPADMDPMHCLPRRVKVIEDCAHAVGSRYRGRTAGTLGDAAAFSFRLGKPISAGNLGMMLSSDREVIRRARDVAARFPPRSITGHVRDCLVSMFRGFIYRPPWFGTLGLPVGSIFDDAFDLMDKHSFRPMRPSVGSLAVLADRFLGLPRRVRVARERAAVLASYLRGTSISPPSEAPWAFHTYFQFAMRFRDRGARERGAAGLRDHGVDSIRFYQDSPAIAARYGYRRDCATAESLAKTILTVPCHANLSNHEFGFVADAVRAVGEVI